MKLFFLQNEYYYLRLVYIWVPVTRYMCEIIPKHFEQTEHLQEQTAAQKRRTCSWKRCEMHLYEMSLDHCQALILTSFSPNTENPDDFHLLPIYLNSVIVLE